MDKVSKIFIAGHRGMVGSAIHRLLIKRGHQNLIKASHNELDLLDPMAVKSFFARTKPQIVILAAAKVGGIQANIENPGKFLYENLVIQNNVIHESFLSGVEKLVFLGSSCIYPKECPQPMKEEYLLTGKLEPTNEGYALAKIAGLKLLEGYAKQYKFNSISLMPCNLYGPNDSFDLAHSHVLSALVKRFTEAASINQEEITLWGTGIARREFMHVDDVAEATVYMMEHYNSPEFINIGWGEDISIKELAEMIAPKVGFKGQINWDASKPNGMLKKCMDVSKMESLGFSPKITLDQGVDQMISIYKQLIQRA
jgi:GDP-L-fucose synthase